MLDVVGQLELRLLGEGKAERTVREYVKWAARLQRWCLLEGIDLTTIQPHQVRTWVDATVPPSRESRKQAYTALSHLFRMLARTDEPWKAIRVPHKRRGKPRPLTEPERILLRDTAVMVGSRKGLATLGILQTGARPSEVAGWRWDGIESYDAPDVSGSVGRLRFWRPKVLDWHEVPLRPLLGRQLQRARPADAEGHIFPGNNGRAQVRPETVWEWVREVGRIAGIDGVNPRRLRATAVTRVLEETESVDLAAGIAGHSDPSVTLTYYIHTSWGRLTGASAALD